jgi:hypothetical protein
MDQSVEIVVRRALVVGLNVGEFHQIDRRVVLLRAAYGMR